MRMKMQIALDVDHTIMPKSQMGTMTLAMEQKWRKIVHHLVITKQGYTIVIILGATTPQ